MPCVTLFGFAGTQKSLRKTVSMILTYYTLCNRAEIQPFCTPPKVLQQLLDDAVKQFLQNGATAKTTHVKKPCISRKIKGESGYMKLGVVESEPVSISLRKRTNADKA